MKQGSFARMPEVGQTTLWAAVILCCESVLTAVPTITISSNAQSAGLYLEGIVVPSPDTLHPIEIGGLAEMLTTGEEETVRHSRLLREDAAAVWDLRPGGISSVPRQELDYIMFSPSLVGGTPADHRLASGTPWPEVTSVYYDATPWLPRRY